jgi:hypothetical protein
LRSWLKWFETVAWTAANVRRLRMRLNRSIARYRRQDSTHHKAPNARDCCRITA